MTLLIRTDCTKKACESAILKLAKMPAWPLCQRHVSIKALVK